MKSQHEAFDDELSDRLQHYTEDPDEDYWQGIASNIVSVNSEPRWVVWQKRLSFILVGVLVLLVSNRTSIMSAGDDKFIASSLPPQRIEHINEQRNVLLPDKTKKQSFVSGQSKSREVTNQKTGFQSGHEIVQPFKDNDKNVLHMELLILGEDDSQMNPDSLPGALSTPLEPSTMIANDTPKIIVRKLLELKSDRKVEDQKRNLRSRKYILYFTAMPTLGYQRIESNQTDNLIIESIDRIPAFSAKRLGIRVELGVEYPVSRKLKVFGGLLYYQRKQTIGYTEKHLDSMLMIPRHNGGEILVVPQYSYLNKSIEYELKNVGIQIGLNYTLSPNRDPGFSSKDAISSKRIPIPKKTFSHTIGTGLEFHKAFNKTNEFDKANGFSNPSAYVFYNVYYRLQYPSEGKLRAIFQPTLNYSFYINENLHTPFYVKPYGLGFNFGCVYNF